MCRFCVPEQLQCWHQFTPNESLPRENVCEMDLVLAGAGLLELTDDQIKNMTVCPVHHYTLGKYWQAPKTCQYPKHHRKKMAIARTHVINFKTAREIKNIFGVKPFPLACISTIRLATITVLFVHFIINISELKGFVFLNISTKYIHSWSNYLKVSYGLRGSPIQYISWMINDGSRIW